MPAIGSKPGARLSIENTLDKMLLDRARLAESMAKLDHDIAALRRILAEYGGAMPSSEPALQVPPTAVEIVPPKAQVGTGKSATFDGTFAGLIQRYRRDERSSYHQLKHKIRVNYDNTLDRLIDEIGKERVADWSAQIIQARYDERWAADGKVSAGHSIIGKLRLLSSFGSVVLNDDRCTRLSTILGNMRFPVARVRTEILTIDHARAIRAVAHEHFNWPSIALAQAFQFELPKLKQVGVIGEWVPLSEPGTSEITKDNEKWVRGLRWSDIDENMMMRKMLTSGRQNQPKEHVFNLGRAAMVMEEINRVPQWKRTGPMIICEFSNLPWSHNEYRRKWRKVADKAGVPTGIKNMDSARPESEAEEPVYSNMEELPIMK
jgi:hypothetical protein